MTWTFKLAWVSPFFCVCRDSNFPSVSLVTGYGDPSEGLISSHHLLFRFPSGGCPTNIFEVNRGTDPAFKFPADVEGTISYTPEFKRGEVVQTSDGRLELGYLLTL